MTATVGSLFSGIGGIDLGFEMAGWRVAWQAETDPFCRRVLRAHWPTVPNLGDVRMIEWDHVESVDVICGGFPCQPASVAGQGLGPLDERWLWPWFARAVRLLRPRFVFVENVSGLVTRGFGQVARDLADYGYDMRWDCIPAAAVGAPHLRNRLFVVADADGGRRHRIGQPESPGIAGARGRVVDGRGSNGQLEHAAHVADAESRAGRTGQPEQHARSSHKTARFADGGQRRYPWRVEPDVGRMAYGIPDRVDRLRALGNAVVPQVAEWIVRNWLPTPGSLREEP